MSRPLGGVRVGPQPRYSRDYDRPAYRAYGYDRGYRGCRTVTIEARRRFGPQGPPLRL